MRKSEISAALDALKEIKWDKIEDKALRDDLMTDHFVMFDAQKKLEAEQDRLKEVIISPYKEDQQEVDNLNRKIQSAETVGEQREYLRQALAYDGFNKAAKEFNDRVEELYKEEVHGLKKIDREKFTEEIKKQAFKISWIEGLYPLFILD